MVADLLIDALTISHSIPSAGNAAASLATALAQANDQASSQGRHHPVSGIQRDLAAAAAQVKGKAKPVEPPTVATITTAIPVKNGSMATTSGSSTTHGKDDGLIRPIARTRRRHTAGALF